jgi:hypothetical protein
MAIGIGCSSTQLIGFAEDRCTNQVRSAPARKPQNFLTLLPEPSVDPRSFLRCLDRTRHRSALRTCRLASADEAWSQSKGHHGVQLQGAVSHILLLLYGLSGIALMMFLSLIALAIVHLHYIITFIDRPNTGVALIMAIAFQQVQLSYALISSTIPTLKTFVRSFNTNMGLDVTSTLVTYGYGTNKMPTSRHTTENYELKDTAAVESQASSQSARKKGMLGRNFRPEPIEHSASIVHLTKKDRTPSAERSHMSNDSQEMIIRRNVDFQVHYD